MESDLNFSISEIFVLGLTNGKRLEIDKICTVCLENQSSIKLNSNLNGLPFLQRVILVNMEFLVVHNLRGKGGIGRRLVGIIFFFLGDDVFR
jgi:hypothetical protein